MRLRSTSPGRAGYRRPLLLARSPGFLGLLVMGLCTVFGVTAGVVSPAAASTARDASPSAASARPALPATRPVFNVRGYGATGNGTTNDTPAINSAIATANAAGPLGGVVEFPAGTYLAGGSIHMMSNVTLHLDAGSVIMGAPSGYDPPEPNPYSQYQDFGHSHFHDAMIWGDRLTNIGFTGSGTIDGGGNLNATLNDTAPGQADKIISLTRCSDLTVSGITLRRPGHFGILLNDCNGVRSDHLTINNPNRDGWNIVNTRNVSISHANIASNDDALVFKSDWALGETLPSGNVTVTNSALSAGCCSALNFGSETCGSFTNYHFSHIVITGADYSGLGMVSMDGARISNVYYNDIKISRTQSPIFVKIGARRRCGGNPTVGSISGIHYQNITATDAGAYTPTLWGQPGHPITDVTFSNVHLTLPGGHAAMDPNQVPTDAGGGAYYPDSIGTRPAYGFYLHNTQDVTFTDSSLRLASDDARPALIANASSKTSLHNVTVQRGTGSPFDVGFQGVNGYCLTNAATTDGRTVRISTPGSVAGCQARLDDFSLSAAPDSQTVTAGTSATYTVSTAVQSGTPAPIDLTASGQPAGMSISFSPDPVVPGDDSTMTVTTTPTTHDRTYTLQITGTDPAATQYAAVTLTVTGGEPIATDLHVADPTNAASWSIQPDLANGDLLYGDRTYPVSNVPTSLLGAQWIRTANGSKSSTADPLVTFTLNAPANVSVAVDSRLGRLPWMDASWIDTGTALTDTEGSVTRIFEIYQKAFPAGQVALGPDGNANSSMYTIILS